MVFTYYRIYVIASQQTRSLKLGVKQIEMSSITDGGSGTSAEFQSGFTLRIHRGGYQINSGAPVLQKHHHNTINYHSVSHDMLSLSKSESYDMKTSADNLPAGNHSEYDYDGDRSQMDGNSQISRQLRNNKANWSVGRRLAKLAKGKHNGNHFTLKFLLD